MLRLRPTRELMQRLRQSMWEAERKTVFFVTQGSDEALFMGNRVVMMSAQPGRIRCNLPRKDGAFAPLSAQDRAYFHAAKSAATTTNQNIRLAVKGAAALAVTAVKNS